jgi:uncharacterized membrane protein
MKGGLLILTIFLTGLSSGLFYSWAISVIPGTKRVTDLVYLEAMQSINKAIINPWFLVIFLGPIILITLAAVTHYKYGHEEVFGLILVAGLFYIIGTFGVTVFGNIPMNEALETVQINELSTEGLKDTRQAYEGRWNKLHYIRTISSVISFGLLLFALNYSNSTIN